tara:strand:- start:489 stop:749 length:261 start_codon:yes stop_codon:yes gene_type:complete
MDVQRNKRRNKIARLIEDDEDFKRFVTKSAEFDTHLGFEQSELLLNVLDSENEGEYVLALSAIGFIIYTDYLLKLEESFYQHETFH